MRPPVMSYMPSGWLNRGGEPSGSSETGGVAARSAERAVEDVGPRLADEVDGVAPARDVAEREARAVKDVGSSHDKSSD